MPRRVIVIMGAGIAGLASALLLARDGAHVVLTERDTLEIAHPMDSPSWDRRGIPHFLQPHAFIPRGRAELKRCLPDVYQALIDAGACDVDLRPRMPSDPTPLHEDLQYLAVRRPVIEWALRRAASEEPDIEVRAGTTVTGLLIEKGRVRGIRLGSSTVCAELVVDATGRRSRTREWLSDAGVVCPTVESSDCGVVYYSRYYVQRPGFELPDGPWLLSPRGDLGYLGYSTFQGDNRTFAAVLAVPAGVPEWRDLKGSADFEAAVAQIPALASWADPQGAEPITDVLPMAGLRNTLRDCAPLGPAGLVAVGDAYGHTDPLLAHGLAFGLIHARALALAVRTTSEVRDAAQVYSAATWQELRERYEFATALDDQRRRRWLGDAIDFTHRDGSYELFSMLAAGAAALVDPEVSPMFLRRIGLLDSTAVLDGDVPMQRRIEEIVAQISASPRQAAGPSREAMLASMQLGAAGV